MTAQIVEISGQKMVMLPIADYERLVDLAEDRLDGAIAEAAATRRADGEEYLPIELLDRLMAGENALKVWREHRGLNQTKLAEMVGVSKNHISDMERGDGASVKIWKKTAKALKVDVQDVIPLAS